MSDLLNIYEYNRASEVVEMLSSNIIGPRIGIKVITSENSINIFLFKVNGHYVLPGKIDEVKYLGNGNWKINEWSWS